MRERIDQDEIYQAALEVFAEYGYKKTTVKDVAEKLNRTKGNLYIYIKDKEDLYTKTVSYALEKWQNKVKEAVEKEKKPQHQFLVMCKKAVEYLADDEPLRNVLKRDPDIFPLFPVTDPFELINSRSIDMIKTILRNGIKIKVFRKVDVEKVSRVIFSIYKMFVIRTYIQTDEAFMRELFNDTLDLFMNGLLNET